MRKHMEMNGNGRFGDDEIGSQNSKVFFDRPMDWRDDSTLTPFVWLWLKRSNGWLLESSTGGQVSQVVKFTKTKDGQLMVHERNTIYHSHHGPTTSPGRAVIPLPCVTTICCSLHERPKNIWLFSDTLQKKMAMAGFVLKKVPSGSSSFSIRT